MTYTPELANLPGVRMLCAGEPFEPFVPMRAPVKVTEERLIFHLDCRTGVLTLGEPAAVAWLAGVVREGIAMAKAQLGEDGPVDAPE